jgi:hypothetical protein
MCVPLTMQFKIMTQFYSLIHHFLMLWLTKIMKRLRKYTKIKMFCLPSVQRLYTLLSKALKFCPSFM